METINKTVIITLDFFEIIDGFEEQAETNEPGNEEDNYQHTSMIWAEIAKLDAGSLIPHQQPIPPSGPRLHPYQNEK